MYRTELHLHTALVSPCGQIGAPEIVEIYIKKGYQTLVITDHYVSSFMNAPDRLNISLEKRVDLFFEGFREVKQLGDAAGLYVLPGLELCLNQLPNDYLIYGVSRDFLIKHPLLYELSLAELSSLLHANGCLLYQAHPFRDGMTQEGWEYLDGMEIHNGHPTHNARNPIAAEFAKAHSLPGISGSDCHFPSGAGRGGILTEEPVRSLEDLCGALRAGTYTLIRTGEYEGNKNT